MLHANELAASMIHIERKQLDEWDASARAWLQYADSVKKVEQTNLRLVIDGANLPVSRDKELYSSVMAVWKHAMKAMNDLILGRPQRINDGDVMLGLLSWHLYPDMTVLGVGTRTYHVPQQDGLIAPGGMITVGMGRREGCPDEAIYWSLPLAHMRFYGNAVNAERRHGLKDSQVSYADFRYVILGSVLSSWDLEKNDLDLAMQCIILLGDSIITNEPSQSAVGDRRRLNWLLSLAECCKSFQRANEFEKKHGMALIMFGIRRCPKFLANDENHPLPLFDLTEMKSLMDLVEFPTTDTTQRQIDFLRWWAHNYPNRSSLKGSIIQYRPTRGKTQEPSLKKAGFLCTSVFITSKQTGHKRRRIENFTFGNQGHRIWAANNEYKSLEQASTFDYLEAHDLNGTGTFLNGSSLRTVPGLREHGTVMLPPDQNMCEQKYEFVCGDESRAALYRPVKYDKPQLSRNTITLAGLLQLYKEGYVKVPRLIRRLRAQAALQSHFYGSLNALSSVEEIYNGLPGACIDLRITSQPAPESRWSTLLRGRESKTTPSSLITRAFTVVAFFETGEIQLEPRKLEGVLALSHKNSIFVASQMLEDPAKLSSKHLIRRLTGNIGRPGLALLIPPNNPRMQKYDFNKYVVEYEPFNGDLVDSFSATSLHLSLTGYELPVDVEPRDNRDSEAYFVETNVSVYDGGEWVGDVDIMRARRTWLRFRDCHHNAEQRKQRNHLPNNMQAVDSWRAFLDAPVGAGVLRAFGNPMARLAAATLAMQKRYNFHILGPDPCWKCVQHDVFPRQPSYIGSQRGLRGYFSSSEHASEEISDIDTGKEANEVANDCSDESGFDSSDEDDLEERPESLYSADIGDGPADDDAQELSPDLEPISETDEVPTNILGTGFAVDVVFIC
ncbi:hypothetical protein AA0119_g10778 [Alternaria tenuissima]|uniref:FHA domain-containing protein n=3 Tax=Alternaria tenuissima TaxID=119927 RepID=A0ABY0FXY3_9PLEO|nr:hypothetical protein AA0119_g10778 [Alternaria tenuissima]